MPDAPTNLRITPKQTFLADKDTAHAHTDFMASPQFQRAASAALLEYQMRLLPGGTEPTSLAAVSLKLSGAQGFLNLLMNLAEPEAPAMEIEGSGLQAPEEFWKKAPNAT